MSLKMREVLAEAKEALYRAGIEENLTDAWLLLESVFQIDRTYYFLNMERDIAEIQNGMFLYENYKEAVSKRCRHIPLQYITGHQIFMGIDFEVNEHVLIPRQDTEILAERALKLCRELGQRKECSGKNLRILDMCTGSGCLAVSIGVLAGLPLTVTAADISRQALCVAGRNAKKNHCQIEFIQSDLFENLNGRTFDIILSNPPYIKSADILGLMEEVKDYEPLLALDGEADGLKFYRKITNGARAHLKTKGYLLYEIGCEQADDVSKILEENEFEHIQIWKDLAGLNRVITAQYKGAGREPETEP